MANAPAHAPVFSRGSTVLEYWLVHAEGLTVQPLGARVERVVVAAPEGRAESLVVRSGVTRRRTRIPAGAIAAVQPSAGELLLDPAAAPQRPQVHVPHPSSDRIADVARRTQRGTASVARRTQRSTAIVARRTQRGTVDAAVWARPRVAQAADRTAQGIARATEQTARGLAWLTPRVVAVVRAVALVAAQLVFAGAVVVTRVAAHAARAAASAAAQGRASIEARRARQR